MRENVSVAGNGGQSRVAALLSRSAPGGIRPLFWQGFGYAILPLRLFLGFTFFFAGMQKLANPNFFNPKSPISIQSQIVAYQRFSPLHLVLHILAPYAAVVGVILALSEIAVGLGLSTGVLPRLAAAGGMLISFSLFLTVSFHANPYYTGADIVFFFAMTPIAIAGTGGIFSLSTFLRRKYGLPTEIVVASGFQMIQQTCGMYDNGNCTGQSGSPCGVRSCPILFSAPLDTIALNPENSGKVQRREFLTHISAVGVLGTVGLGSGIATAFFGRKFKNPNTPTYTSTSALNQPDSSSGGITTSTTTTTMPSNTGTTEPSIPSKPLPKGASEIGNTSELAIGKVASFVDPVTKSPAYILRPTSTKYVAFSAICPHAGCTVQYDPNGTFVCPCHGSTFDSLTGAVEIGPAAKGLTPIPITISSNLIYADPPL